MTVNQVNAEVSAFVQCRWSVHRAIKVTENAGNNLTDFCNDSEASISFSTRGNLHHETCHLIIERLSKNNLIEECIKEGICDAYKFFNMRINSPCTYNHEDNMWYEKITRYKDMNIKDILSTSNDMAHDIIYEIPASRIVKQLNSLNQLSENIHNFKSATYINDPNPKFVEMLQFCWQQWKLMNGKTEDEKQLLKNQIKKRLLELLSVA